MLKSFFNIFSYSVVDGEFIPSCSPQPTIGIVSKTSAMASNDFIITPPEILVYQNNRTDSVLFGIFTSFKAHPT